MTAGDFVLKKGFGNDIILEKYTGSGGHAVIPEGVTTIGEKAFKDCSALAGVSIPEGMYQISSGAFEGCTGLVSVSIPESVRRIGSRAFFRCSALAEVNDQCHNAAALAETAQNICQAGISAAEITYILMFEQTDGSDAAVDTAEQITDRRSDQNTKQIAEKSTLHTDFS